MRILRFINRLSPGDALVMSAAIYSLHRNHPGKFLTGVDTPYAALWEHNPDIASEAELAGAEEVQSHYPAWHEAPLRPVHFLAGYAEFFQHALQVPVPLKTNRPMICLSEEEKQWKPQVPGKWWLINSGTKRDFTAKAYPHFQEVVDRLQGRIQFVQVGAINDMHKPLKGTINLLGKTDLRQLIRLCYHAQGVLTGVSLLMHLSAAFCKPSVVVAGARESRSWNVYPGQMYLSNVGSLPCSMKNGEPWACLKSRVIRLGDGSDCDQSLCEQPMLTDPPSAKCMTLIHPSTVVDAIESYYHGGVLSY